MNKSSNFVKGCDNFHIKSLRKYSQSDGHCRCVENAKARCAVPGMNPTERVLEALHEKEFEKMRVMFRVSHSLAKNEGHFRITNGPLTFRKLHIS